MTKHSLELYKLKAELGRAFSDAKRLIIIDELRDGEKAVGDFPNARLIPVEEHNILPFIFVADTMISEASSTIFEFLALGKIGVIFDLDCGRLKHSDGMPILDEDNTRFLEGAFIHIRSPEEIRPAVEKALDPDDGMKADVMKHRDELFFELDGHASERIVETIDTLLGERR